MASLVQDENKQMQISIARKKQPTREEQLAAWKKRKELLKRKSNKVAKRRISIKSRESKLQSHKNKSIQKRLHHSGKKMPTKEKKFRRVEQQIMNDRKDLFLTRQLPGKQAKKNLKPILKINDARHKIKSKTELNTNVSQTKLVPKIRATFNNSTRLINEDLSTELVKSPHRIETLQQRLSNSARKRKELERRRTKLMNAKKAQSSRRAIISSKLSVKQITPNSRNGILWDQKQPLKSKKQIEKTKDKYDKKHSLVSKTHANAVNKIKKVPNSQDKVAKQIPSGGRDQLDVQAQYTLTPTQKNKLNVSARSSAGQYPLFHNNSPAIQRIVNMMSPLMSPLIKTAAIEKDCQIIAEDDVPDFEFVLSIDNDDLHCTSNDDTEKGLDSTNDDVENNKLLARKDVSKIRNAPSSVIRMKKIKLNATDQIHTGSKHAITPVRRSVRITSNGNEDFEPHSTLLEEVDFVFQPNKHLENTYFSDNNQKCKKKLFQIQAKDGSYRRGTPRPTKASCNLGVLPIYNQTRNGGVVTPPEKSEIEKMPPPSKS